MKNIREVYPNCEYTRKNGKKHFDAPYDYRPLLESFNYKILLQVDDHDYHGDSRILFQDGDRYGILIFGWGSCSGCDALQGCKSYEELEKLQQSLHNSIRWGTAEELLKYISTKDWSLEWSWTQKETRQFIKEATKILQKQISQQ